MRWAIIRIAGVLAILLTLSSAVLAQCPLCKAVLMSSKEGQRLVNGFDHGILFLLSVPFLLVGVFALRVARAQRTPRRRQMKSAGHET